MLTFDDITSAAERLKNIAHRTPVQTSQTVNDRTGAKVFFKCENFQKVGAFKFRGAYNTLSRLTPEEQKKGIVTYSSGNHAQAAALAGRMLDVPVVIVMPFQSPNIKYQATVEYGAEIVQYDLDTGDRKEIGEALAKERGLKIIPPYDHPHIIAGQGTTALELFQDVGDLDYLLVPCGGGGLLSGCAVVASTMCPGCQVVGVEPENGDDATRSFRTGVLHTVKNPQTIADGARTPFLGQLTFPLVLKYVSDMMTVSDDDLLKGMLFLWERMKLIVEPTGVLGAAPLLSGAFKAPGKRVGVILSGGNVDWELIPEIFEKLLGRCV